MAATRIRIEFPTACDRCGRTLRLGETAAVRTYPHRTYITHVVCPGRKRPGGGKDKCHGTTPNKEN